MNKKVIDLIQSAISKSENKYKVKTVYQITEMIKEQWFGTFFPSTILDTFIIEGGHFFTCSMQMGKLFYGGDQRTYHIFSHVFCILFPEKWSTYQIPEIMSKIQYGTSINYFIMTVIDKDAASKKDWEHFYFSDFTFELLTAYYISLSILQEHYDAIPKFWEMAGSADTEHIKRLMNAKSRPVPKSINLVIPTNKKVDISDFIPEGYAIGGQISVTKVMIKNLIHKDAEYIDDDICGKLDKPIEVNDDIIKISENQHWGTSVITLEKPWKLGPSTDKIVSKNIKETHMLLKELQPSLGSGFALQNQLFEYHNIEIEFNQDIYEFEFCYDDNNTRKLQAILVEFPIEILKEHKDPRKLCGQYNSNVYGSSDDNQKETKPKIYLGTFNVMLGCDDEERKISFLEGKKIISGNLSIQAIIIKSAYVNKGDLIIDPKGNPFEGTVITANKDGIAENVVMHLNAPLKFSDSSKEPEVEVLDRLFDYDYKVGDEFDDRVLVTNARILAKFDKKNKTIRILTSNGITGVILDLSELEVEDENPSNTDNFFEVRGQVLNCDSATRTGNIYPNEVIQQAPTQHKETKKKQISLSKFLLMIHMMNSKGE